MVRGDQQTVLPQPGSVILAKVLPQTTNTFVCARRALQSCYLNVLLTAAVLCPPDWQVARVNPRLASVDILCVGSRHAASPNTSEQATRPYPAFTSLFLNWRKARVGHSCRSRSRALQHRRAVVGKFSGIIRQQDVRLTEIDKVDLYACFRPGDVVRCRRTRISKMPRLAGLVCSSCDDCAPRPCCQVRAEVLSLGDSRSYYLTTAKDEYGVVHAKGPTGEALVPLSWQDMQVREPLEGAR